MKNAYPQLKATTLAVAVAALFAQPLIQAQETNDKKLQAVEVVGTSPLPGLGIEKNKLPYDVQSYGGEDIHNSQSINIPEYMSRNLTGVNINEFQGSPFQADITYRGFRLSGLLGTSQGLSVYLDGVRVNEPFGDVVNWDMIPEAAISNISLIPGSNPVYGLNTLGGALAFTTKSGLTAPGTDVKLSLGSFMRKRADVTYGEKSQDGSHRFIAATAFHEDGWRDYSSGQLGNVFAKVGKTQADVNWDVSLLHGQSNLLGNGLLPSHGYDDGGTVAGMYQTNRRWVYTHPDRTKNQLTMLNFNLQRLLDGDTQLATNAYVRSSNRRCRIRKRCGRCGHELHRDSPDRLRNQRQRDQDYRHSPVDDGCQLRWQPDEVRCLTRGLRWKHQRIKIAFRLRGSGRRCEGQGAVRYVWHLRHRHMDHCSGHLPDNGCALQSFTGEQHDHQLRGRCRHSTTP
jgi:hypothetical protein